MFKSINGGIPPQRTTKYSAGFDVFANEDVVIGAGETKLIGLGIALDIESMVDEQGWIKESMFSAVRMGEFLQTHYFALHIRSSLRAKGLTSLGTGIIDMDYRDEIKMVIHKPYETKQEFAHGIPITAKISYKINKGDKIGQLILCRHEGWILPSEYTKDEERNGGFGSTGN